ncbi:high affinity choline transporter 1-like [Hypanus sabinus]|uniref:high affinity choline transporter 1-like n=1 Tax=Hypanus sabinus TaxID=79690 RepID=UPI0028C3C900|nr:high affinity choline transporter 1-like [Hypanus sabinus]
MAFNLLGLVAVIVFYMLILATGIWASRKSKREEKSCPGPRSEVAMVGGRNIGTLVGIFTTTGGFFFVKPMRTKQFVTMMDPFQEKFGRVLGSLLLIPAVLGDIFWSAAILAALGATMTVILDIETYLSIILSACVVTIYTLLGGLYSVAYTDVMQMVFIVISLWFCVPFAIMNPAVADIKYTMVNELYQSPWIGKIETNQISRWIDDLLYMSLGGIPWQVYFQRVLAASSTSQARKTSYIAGVFCFTLSFPSIIIGAVAVSTDWNQTSYGLPTPSERQESSMILPIVLQYLCPAYVAMLGIGAVSAAVMSSADSSLLSASSMFARNIYKTIIRKKAAEKEVIWIMRTAVVLFGALATVLAILTNSIYGLWFLSSEFVYAILFPQLVCVLFIPSTNTYGSAAGYLIGLTLRLLAGEPFLQIPPIIQYPGISFKNGTFEQRFPFKTFTMLLSLLSTVVFSYLASFVFKRKILPVRFDVFKITEKVFALSCLHQAAPGDCVYNSMTDVTIPWFKAKSKESTTSIMELQYADDNTTVVHSEEDLQCIMSPFVRSYLLLGLNLNIKKAQVLHQPVPDQAPKPPTIQFDNIPLENTDHFPTLAAFFLQKTTLSLN